MSEISEMETLPPLASTELDARDLAGHLSGVMDTLSDIIVQETALVRAGRLKDAAGLDADKTELARSYIADTMRLKASRPYIGEAIPDELKELQQQHDAFRAVLQTNLTVLATAHAVSEGIVRGVSNELTRLASPQAYDANGQAMVPHLPTPPMAVSRIL